jgi:peptide/nickel transport system substrate-binding protein
VNGYASGGDVRLPFDPTAAAALLAEAGYPQRLRGDARLPNNRYIKDEQICQNIAAMWSRVGVRTTLRAQPLATFFAQIQRDDTSVYMLGWGVPTLDALYSFQSLLATRNGDQGDGIWNYGRYSNPRMDALVQRMKWRRGGAPGRDARGAAPLPRGRAPHPAAPPDDPLGAAVQHPDPAHGQQPALFPLGGGQLTPCRAPARPK